MEDPSKRSAAEILREFNDPRIRHLRNPKRTSFSEQLNRGLAETRADLIARADGDDICEPDRLEKQVAFMQAHPEVTVLGTQLAIINGDGKLLGYRRYPCDHDSIVAALRLFNPIAHPSVMFRRKAALKAGGISVLSIIPMRTTTYGVGWQSKGLGLPICPKPWCVTAFTLKV